MNPQFKKLWVDFLKNYGYIFIIVIIVIVVVIFNKKVTPGSCNGGQEFSEIYGTGECITSCGTGTGYSCDLKTCLPNNCSPDTNSLVNCANGDWTCVSTTPINGSIDSFDKDKCDWVGARYTQDNCKLINGDDSNQTFYKDCVDYTNNDSSYGQIKAGTIVSDTNRSFTCGEPSNKDGTSYSIWKSKNYSNTKGINGGDPFGYNILTSTSDTVPGS